MSLFFKDVRLKFCDGYKLLSKGSEKTYIDNTANVNFSVC